MRDKFLPQLADIYGGGQGQQNLIDSAMQSPLYKQLIGNIEGGTGFAEEAMLRNRSATGGLRSGGSIEDMARLQFEQQNQKNAALTQTYGGQLQGIQGLAGIPLNTNAIGAATAAPFQTQALGVQGAGQARADAQQGWLNAAMGAGGAALMAPTGTFSDIRAKENIKYLGQKNGHNIYSWFWNKLAEDELGLTGKSCGVLAHEVYSYMPEAIDTSQGYLMVNYDMLGLNEVTH